MSSSAPAKAPAPQQPGAGPTYGALDRFFRISERGSTLPREVRGGLATFFAMAYIIVLNPIILGSAKDMYGHQLDNGQLVTATALTAALTTLLMGVIGNVPIALAAGLGVNSVVALQLAPRMSWPDAMGMVVLAGFVVMLLVATGLRERVMNAVPYGLRKAISIGIGLFIMLIGLVDAGFVSRIPDAAQTTVPLQLGGDGHLNGWPVLVFVLGVLLTLALIVRKVSGAILISIVAMTVLAVIINAVAKVPSWGLTTPKWPGNPVASPDFGLIGQVSLFGGFGKVGMLTGVLFVFTVLLSCFFDAMGTIMGVSDEAKLTEWKDFARRTHRRLPTAVGEKTMPDDLRLLLEAIVFEPPAGLQLVAVAAEGVAHQRQVETAALLRLPDMGQLMNEEPLPMQRLPRKVLRPQVRMRMEMDMPHRRHGDAARLERPPLAADHPHLRIIDRIAENGSRQLNLAGCERARAVLRVQSFHRT